MPSTADHVVLYFMKHISRQRGRRGSIEIYVACVERKNVGNELALLSFDDISGFVKVPEACYRCSREETWHVPS